MADNKDYTSLGSFSKAFAQARKDLGSEGKFIYNGHWYGTKFKSEVNGRGQYASSSIQDNKNKSRTYKAVDKNGNTRYGTLPAGYVWDETLNAPILQEEVTVNSPRLELNRKTSGYLPQDQSDLKDKNGNSRVYKLYETGMHYVTDNFGNIVGWSMDPEAGQPGYKGWSRYTGSSQDRLNAGAADLLTKHNYNEANQLARQKKQRRQEDFINSVYQGQDAVVNTVNNVVKTPAHLIWGAAKALADPNYSGLDYIQGLNFDDLHRDRGQIMGLGSALDMDKSSNPNVNAAGVVLDAITDPMALLGSKAASRELLSRTVLEGKYGPTGRVANGKGVSGTNGGTVMGRANRNPIHGKGNNGYSMPYNTQRNFGTGYSNGLNINIYQPLMTGLEIVKTPGQLNYTPIPGWNSTHELNKSTVRQEKPYSIVYTGDRNKYAEDVIYNGQVTPRQDAGPEPKLVPTEGVINVLDSSDFGIMKGNTVDGRYGTTYGNWTLGPQRRIFFK